MHDFECKSKIKVSKIIYYQDKLYIKYSKRIENLIPILNDVVPKIILNNFIYNKGLKITKHNYYLPFGLSVNLATTVYLQLTSYKR